MSDINIRGVSTFFFWAIPLVLAMATLYWLLFVREVIEVRRGMVMDSRHAEIVGAKVLPRGQIEMVIAGGIANGPVIQRADISGSDLTVWIRNDGPNVIGHRGQAIKIQWKAMSPDGTVVSSGWDFCNWGVTLDPMQIYEATFSIKADSRMKRLELELEK